jgi:glycosyltransferase involved in cell wall biosynthesis
MVLGIDALSLSELGGFNHIIKILSYTDVIKKYSIKKIIIWTNVKLAKVINSNEIIEVVIIENDTLLSRTIWQRYRFGKLAREECDILFAPGGIFINDFRPYVTMFQNMQVFDKNARKLEGISFLRIKFFILRFFQGYSFYNANGLIFISDYAKDYLLDNYKDVIGSSENINIPIGVDKVNFNINEVIHIQDNPIKPLKILYVSTVRSYKHQWNLIDAFALIIKKSYNLELHIVGGGVDKFISKMQKAINRANNYGKKVFYHGNVNRDNIHEFYKNSDIFAYASSCENAPSIILEAMSYGLPIISSKLRPMTDIMGKSALYFDHDDIDSIALAMENMINNLELRKKISRELYKKSLKYTWKKCADETFAFFRYTADNYYKQLG